MNKSLNFFLGLMLCAAILCSCGGTKPIPSPSNTYHLPENIQEEQKKSVDNLLNQGYKVYMDGNEKYLLEPSDIDTQNNVDSIQVNIQLKSFYYYRQYNIDTNEVKTFCLKNESDLINFNNQVGFKFYRLTLNEFGVIYNYIKFDVYTKLNDYWIRVGSHRQNFNQIQLNKNSKPNLNAKMTSNSENIKYALNYGYFYK